ncbi:MAG: hypothetical protein AMJ66_10160 [Betaproteobacteria bacterium SG8_40]|nr:MAG: hypothetical protein AMJ66_10160 [Betaproteobacteria bacterium SG8_40]
MQVLPAQRLPVAKVVAGALILSWERRYALLSALWLPLLLGIVFSVSETVWGPSSWESGTAEENARRQTALLLWTLPLFALTVVFAVRSYRVYLLGGDDPQAFAPISWGLRETRFIFAIAGVAFVFATALFMLSGVLALVWPGVGEFAGSKYGIALVLPPAYLAGRLLLAFPALASDRTEEVFQALLQSWKITNRNGWRVVVLCVILPGVVAWVLEQVSQIPVPGITVLTSIAVWLVMPVELALVALAYVSLRPDDNTPPPEEELV